MKCPFLRDASVKYCEASAYRKMLLKEATRSNSERCSSPGWVGCSAARTRLSGLQPSDSCPFLHEVHAEFCGAASVTKFIPATADLLSRCNSDGHLYCQVYLAQADPRGERHPRRHGNACQGPAVDGIPVPPQLFYAPNHMWLDVAGDGYCHVGIDAFAASVLGPVEEVTFVTQRSPGRPCAVLRTNGVDVAMVFPNLLNVSSANVYLRTATDRLTEDPYGSGWLFECVEPSFDREDGPARGLVTGERSAAWMADETRRLNEFAHQRLARLDSDGAVYMGDGGTVEEGLASHLDRDELIDLVSEFFAPQTGWWRS